MADIPLFSLEAEQSVLGGLFVSPVKFADVAAVLTAEDFSRHDHRLIFAAVQRLAAANTPMDLTTVGEWLESHGQCPEPVNLGYLVQLARETPSAANVLAYAEVVRSRSQRRKLLTLADQLAVWANAERDAGKVISQMRQALDALDSASPQGGLRPLADILPDVLAELDQRAHRTQALLGQSTGLGDLDTLLDGLCAGRLYVVAGRPSSGKSVLGLQLARQALLAQRQVAFFSLEMPESEVVHRLLAAEIPLNVGRIQSAKLSDPEWLALANRCEALKPAPLWIDASSEMTIGELQSRVRRLHRKTPLGLVVVDYIGLLDGDTGGSSYSNRVQEISSITRALKQLAKELDCPVVALAQLNRLLEQRADKRPILSDLRESGSVEQDADVVLMVYRDELHNPESPDKGCAELLIRKNRGGPVGVVNTLFDGAHCQFKPLAGPLPSHGSADTEPAAPRRRGFRRGGDQ